MTRLVTPFVYVVLVSFLAVAQEESKRPPRQLPPPTDIDPKLTGEFRQLERELGDAILHKDAKSLDRLVGVEYTLRVSDIPQGSLPRAIWIDNTLNRLKAESFDQRHHAARKLADDLTVVSLLHIQKATIDGRDFSGDFYLVDFWKKRGGNWQIIARYSSPVGKILDPYPKGYYRWPGLQRRFLLSRFLEETRWQLADHCPVLQSGGQDTRPGATCAAPAYRQRPSAHGLVAST